jgi:hypothetical protein
MRHYIDIIHIEKKICESLLWLLLNMENKTKDGVRSRSDMETIGIRDGLWSRDEETNLLGNVVKIKTTCPPACHTLIKKEIHMFFKCLEGVKVLSGYCANIKRVVDKQNYKLIGMKSHDCHVMITQILPVTIRG